MRCSPLAAARSPRSYVLLTSAPARGATLPAAGEAREFAPAARHKRPCQGYGLGAMQSRTLGFRMGNAADAKAALRAVSLAVRLRGLQCSVIPAGRCRDGSYLVVLRGRDASEDLYAGLPGAVTV